MEVMRGFGGNIGKINKILEKFTLKIKRNFLNFQ